MNQPEVIYKFRDWDNPIHRTVLLYNELYLASPKDFNDPYDCRITKNLRTLNTRTKKDEYINKILITSFHEWNKFDKSPEQLIKELEHRLENLDVAQEEFELNSFKKNDLHYGIISFSAIWNELLMWSHYAKSHQGICIGFYEERIRKLPLEFVKGGMVIYDSKFPEIDPLSNDNVQEMFLTTHFKSSEWKYEAEYRISKLNYPDPLSNAMRILNFPDEIFAEVILGLNINNLNKREVVDICKRKNIPVYQAKKIPQKFNLSCVPI